MRLSNVCDEMNLTGCTEWHESIKELTGVRWFLFHYQIESVFITIFLIIIGIIIYHIFKQRRNSKHEGKKDGTN